MALNNGWLKIENDEGSGNAVISATILERNTGRSVTRTATVVGTTAHGAEATAVFTQAPAPPFIIIDHFTDQNLNTITEIPADYSDDVIIVAYANVEYLYAEETSEKEYTDINKQLGLWKSNGCDIYYNGSFIENADEGQAIQSGTDHYYEMRFQFMVDNNTTETPRDIYIQFSDGDTVQVTTMITQSAASEE